MDRESRRKLAHALIVGALMCVVWPSSPVLAQEDTAPAAAASGTAPAEAAPPSRKDRRRGRADATAAQPTAAATPKTAAAETASTEEPAMVCKSIKPLGTRMAKRVCGTPEQWAAFEKKTTDAASDDLRNVRSTGGVIATTPGPAAGP